MSAVCAWCSPTRLAVRKQGRLWLCAKHYRFQQMRVRAKRDGKTVPSYDELADMLAACDLMCKGCLRDMVWLSDGQRNRQVTLQHDRSGEMRFLCLACNTRHSAHPGDEFYQVAAGHKRCPRCERVKDFAAFSADKSRFVGLKSTCKECSREQHREWASRNRERLNARQREMRGARSG